MARIAIIASARTPLRRPFAGGLESLTYGLTTELRHRGHEVVIYASEDSDPDLGVRSIVSDATRLRLTALARGDVSGAPEAFLDEHHAYLTLMLALQTADLDIVHNHSLHYLPIAMAPSLPMPVLTTLHTPPTPWLESAMATLPRDAPNASFVSVSATNARSWRHRGQFLGVVHNGVNLEEWPYCPEPEGDHLVWFGRLVPEKGPHLAIAAARELGRPLVLAGPIGDQDYFTDRIAPHLGDGCEYVGHLDTDHLAALVGSACASLVTPCWEEPYGLTVAESLACGTPVAGCARGALPELVPPSVGALVSGEDPQTLARAVERARGLDRAACRSWVEQHGSVEAMANRYEELYTSLAA